MRRVNFVGTKFGGGKKLESESDGGQKFSPYILPLANSPRCGVCGYEPKESLDKLF